jgi:hypothetical protein
MKLFQWNSTALRRGYHGTWEVRRGRLWLSSLTATIREPLKHEPDDWQHTERGIDWLFPGVAAPVPADWFTGELVSPRGQGNVLHGIVKWPTARVFHVERGAIVGTELRDNG